MFWLLPIISVFSLTCSRPCLHSCYPKLESSCIKSCCPEISLSKASSCSLSCTENSDFCFCEQECKLIKSACEQNCEEFCDSRADDCEKSCLYEFCSEEYHSVNWVYVFGLILLFCGFVAGLFVYVDEVISKSQQEL